MILPQLVLAPSPKGGDGGLGVFTTESIDVETTIEISPVLLLSKEERILVEATKLYHYIFEWGEKQEEAVVGLGYLSMYNHSYHSNCEYEMDYDSLTMRVKTVKPINNGEELLINYNGDFDDTTPVWFDVV